MGLEREGGRQPHGHTRHARRPRRRTPHMSMRALRGHGAVKWDRGLARGARLAFNGDTTRGTPSVCRCASGCQPPRERASVSSDVGIGAGQTGSRHHSHGERSVGVCRAGQRSVRSWEDASDGGRVVGAPVNAGRAKSMWRRIAIWTRDWMRDSQEVDRSAKACRSCSCSAVRCRRAVCERVGGCGLRTYCAYGGDDELLAKDQ